MDVKVERKFQANIRGADGMISAVIYDEQLVKLLEQAERMKAALEAADSAWDSSFHDKRNAARQLVHAALAEVAP